MNTDLDTVLDRVQNILNQLSEVVDSVRAENLEPTATVDLMTVGGWTKMPGRQRWRQIKAISKCSARSAPACHRVEFEGQADDRDGTYVHVDRHTPYPFLTQEQFDTACDRERATA